MMDDSIGDELDKLLIGRERVWYHSREKGLLSDLPHREFEIDMEMIEKLYDMATTPGGPFRFCLIEENNKIIDIALMDSNSEENSDDHRSSDHLSDDRSDDWFPEAANIELSEEVSEDDGVDWFPEASIQHENEAFDQAMKQVNDKIAARKRKIEAEKAEAEKGGSTKASVSLKSAVLEAALKSPSPVFHLNYLYRTCAHRSPATDKNASIRDAVNRLTNEGIFERTDRGYYWIP